MAKVTTTNTNGEINPVPANISKLVNNNGGSSTKISDSDLLINSRTNQYIDVVTNNTNNIKYRPIKTPQKQIDKKLHTITNNRYSSTIGSVFHTLKNISSSSVSVFASAGGIQLGPYDTPEPGDILKHIPRGNLNECDPNNVPLCYFCRKIGGIYRLISKDVLHPCEMCVIYWDPMAFPFPGFEEGYIDLSDTVCGTCFTCIELELGEDGGLRNVIQQCEPRYSEEDLNDKCLMCEYNQFLPIPTDPDAVVGKFRSDRPPLESKCKDTEYCIFGQCLDINTCYTLVPGTETILEGCFKLDGAVWVEDECEICVQPGQYPFIGSDFTPDHAICKPKNQANNLVPYDFNCDAVYCGSANLVCIEGGPIGLPGEYLWSGTCSGSCEDNHICVPYNTEQTIFPSLWSGYVLAPRRQFSSDELTAYDCSADNLLLSVQFVGCVCRPQDWVCVQDI